MSKPHVHKDVIIAYANGANIQYCEFGTWKDIDAPSFHPSWAYRIKPEREYPVTSLTEIELEEIYDMQEGTDLNSILLTRRKNDK